MLSWGYLPISQVFSMRNNEVNMEIFDDNAKKNIELAYAYTENNFKDRRNEIANIKLRLGTLLGFAALLLRFDLDLPNSPPFYSPTSLTKIGALVTCFGSIALLVWALRPQSSGELVDPSSLTNLIKNEDFKYENAELKFEITQKYAKACEELYLLSYKQKNSLTLAIIGLGLNALIVAIKEVLVIFFEK
jgi:hypothetical protein